MSASRCTLAGGLAMMRYAATGNRPFLNMLVHNDDAQREWAYDRESWVGRLHEAFGGSHRTRLDRH